MDIEVKMSLRKLVIIRRLIDRARNLSGVEPYLKYSVDQISPIHFLVENF